MTKIQNILNSFIASQLLAHFDFILLKNLKNERFDSLSTVRFNL